MYYKYVQMAGGVICGKMVIITGYDVDDICAHWKGVGGKTHGLFAANMYLL